MFQQRILEAKNCAQCQLIPVYQKLCPLFLTQQGFLSEMPSSAAAISCGPGETQTESQSVSMPTLYCPGCPDQCINQCRSQGREVSQLECNFWGSEQAVCKCCCGLPSSTTPPKPIAWFKCPTGETGKYFPLPNSVMDCSICVNTCKTECDAKGATVTRELCAQATRNNKPTIPIDNYLTCSCCCKPYSPPPPSPSPPPPFPPPPPPPPSPSPSPPPPPPPPPPPSPSPPPPSPSPPPPPPPPPPSPSSQPCPCSGSCGVDINIKISSVPGQAPFKYELPQWASSTAEL